MKTEIAVFLLLVALLILNGCEAVKTVQDYRTEYCDKTSNSVVKTAAILAIKSQFPLYPIKGICTELLEVL